MPIQIIPLNDLKPHTEKPTCECKPDIELVNGQIIVVHHAFDKREYLEGVCLN